MSAELLYILLAGCVLAVFLFFKSLPWRPVSQNWPPVYGMTLSILLSALFVGYGLYGVIRNDLWLPGKHGPDIHLHGWCVWSFFLATVCAATFFLSAMGGSVPGCRLQVFRRIMFVSGWFFFVLSLTGWMLTKIKQ